MMKFNPTAFINEIKKRPAIWDSGNKSFTSENRNEAWKEVCNLYNNVENIDYGDQAELNQILQKRWKNLRDSYVKFYKRMQLNAGSKITYRFAKRLNFLDSVIATNKISRSKRLIENEYWDEEEEEDEEETEEIQSKLKKPKKRSRGAANNVIDNVIEGPEEINLDEIHQGESSIDFLLENSMDETPSLKNSSSQFEIFGLDSANSKYGKGNCYSDQPHVRSSLVQERDECSVYGELVGVKLRKLNSRTRAYVQHLINNTLFEAEMGKYDKSTAIFPPPPEENAK